MRKEWISTLLLAVLIGALVYLQCEQVFVSRQILARIAEVETMSRSQTWRYLGSDNQLHSHTTTTVFRDAAHPAETKEEWKARFEAEVAADEALYPPVSG